MCAYVLDPPPQHTHTWVYFTSQTCVNVFVLVSFLAMCSSNVLANLLERLSSARAYSLRVLLAWFLWSSSGACSLRVRVHWSGTHSFFSAVIGLGPARFVSVVLGLGLLASCSRSLAWGLLGLCLWSSALACLLFVSGHWLGAYLLCAHGHRLGPGLLHVWSSA